MMTYSVPKLLHLLIVTGANCTLMVAKDCNFTIAVVVQFDLLSNRATRPGVTLELVEQPRHGNGGIVGTEHLGSQTRHVAVQVLVQLRCLRRRLAKIGNPK